MDLIIITAIKIAGFITLSTFLLYVILIILELIIASIVKCFQLLQIIQYIVKNKEVIEEFKTFMSDDEIHRKVLKIIRKEE